MAWGQEGGKVLPCGHGLCRDCLKGSMKWQEGSMVVFCKEDNREVVLTKESEEELPTSLHSCEVSKIQADCNDSGMD